jgi:TonB family protein
MKRVLATALAVGGLTAVLGAQEPAKPGPGVTMPVLVKRVNPDYTAEAKARRIQGNVVLGCVVLTTGAVDRVTVVRSLDAMYGLDEEAVKAMKQWTFKPGTKDGQPVPVSIQVEMTFWLK